MNLLISVVKFSHAQNVPESLLPTLGTKMQSIFEDGH